METLVFFCGLSVFGGRALHLGDRHDDGYINGCEAKTALD